LRMLKKFFRDSALPLEKVKNVGEWIGTYRTLDETHG
jgi:hypothetical protein